MGLKLPVFKKFCCCIPLRTGVVIVAYWSLFSKLLLMWLNIRVLASMMIETSKSGAVVSKLLARAYMFRTVNIIALLVYIILCIMLLVGGRKKKPEYLRHFFMSSLVMTVIDVVVTAFAILYLHHWMFSVALAWIGNRLNFMTTNVYSLLIVRSSFLAMEQKERGPLPPEPEEEVCWDTMQLAHVV